MSSTTEYLVAGLPFPLVPDGPAPQIWQVADGIVTAEAPAKTDLFIDPAGATDPAGNQPMPDAPRLLGTPEGDFQLSARVTVDFHSTFDAGVLAVYADQRNWAKLCFEFTPQGTPSIVTVVTRGESDDANAFELTEFSIWMRISRTGSTFAFHASTDGQVWRLVRYFGLNRRAKDGPVRVGFLAQSPTGEGCTITYDSIEFRPEAPTDLRDGS
jgi:regulation of enolase protein 1 (concanavalin A-like superfamily)